MINKNKGMYIEQLVDRTINYYDLHNLGHIEKRQIPIKILKHINQQLVVAKLINKAKVDYFMFINNKYIEMECKQTNKIYFDLKLIKDHQFKYLKEMKKINVLGIFLLHFEAYDSTIAITCDDLLQLAKKIKKQKIDYYTIKQNGKIINIIYPGILDLKEIFN